MPEACADRVKETTRAERKDIAYAAALRPTPRRGLSFKVAPIGEQTPITGQEESMSAGGLTWKTAT
jgi:hypothetical protein